MPIWALFLFGKLQNNFVRRGGAQNLFGQFPPLMARSEVDADNEEYSSSPHFHLDIKSLIIYNLKKREGSWRYPYGKHRVFCRGCVIIGPVRSWWWLLEIFLLAVTITFIFEIDRHHFVVWIIGLVLYLVVFIASWKTLLTDPGIIKKPPFPKALENAIEAANSVPRFGPLKSAQMYMLSPGGISVRHTYCYRCHVWRPPHSGHCRTCGCCQLEWDHHCPIFGGCVAKKNITSFYIMVISIPVFVVYLLIAGCVSGIQRWYRDGKGIYMASFVVDEIIIGIVLACILPPILAMLPCEKESRDQPPDIEVSRGTITEILLANRQRRTGYETTDSIRATQEPGENKP